MVVSPPKKVVILPTTTAPWKEMELKSRGEEACCWCVGKKFRLQTLRWIFFSFKSDVDYFAFDIFSSMRVFVIILKD